MRGFSLIECLMVLLIGAIILAMALPDHKILFDNLRAKALSAQLVHAINLTRIEAISRGEPLILCGTEDQKKCSAQWARGFLIKSADAVLYHFQQIGSGALQWQGSRHSTYLEFLPEGTLRAEDGTFLYCNKNTAQPAFAVVVNQTGRARVESNPSKTC